MVKRMKIDETTVACIREFVDNKRKEKEILNQIIRDDVFDFLE